MRAVQQIESRVYVCERERELPEAEQTRFHLVALTPTEQAFIEDGYFGADLVDGGRMVRAAQQGIHALSLGISRVDNLLREDGAPVILERDTSQPRLPGGKFPWKEASLAMLPKSVRAEVALQIINHAYLDETTRKN